MDEFEEFLEESNNESFLTMLASESSLKKD